MKKLARVFRDDYNFDVEERYLDVETRPHAQVQLILSTFIHTHEEKGNLLIVYYAGHGWDQWNKETNTGSFKFLR